MQPHERLIARMMAVYGEPKTEDPLLFIDEVQRAIEGYPPAVIDEVGNEIIRKSKFWPRPAEVVEKADAICAKIHANTFKPTPVEDLPPPTEEQRQRAKRILALALNAMKITGAREEAKPLPDVSRDAFEAMIRHSPNRALYADPRALTKRITGERDD